MLTASEDQATRITEIYAKTDHTIDQQDRQYTCKHTRRSFRVTIVAAEKQEVLHIIYHSRSTHAAYFIVVCDLSDCTEIFRVISETARFLNK